MNIFVLDQDPQKAAQYHNDKHCVRMVLETAQLLSTAHRVLDGESVRGPSSTGRMRTTWRHPDTLKESTLYQATHVNHPCAVWTRAAAENYDWLFQLYVSLCAEYTYRYGKVHACVKLFTALSRVPDTLLVTSGEGTAPPQAMPEERKVPPRTQRDWAATVAAYHRYYRTEKLSLAKWTKRPVPYFMNGLA